ncbi:MAG: prohibitin family protein [Burkholderiales bacterium]|nr:prohibitin family protein [Burkholderiales bacterium]
MNQRLTTIAHAIRSAFQRGIGSASSTAGAALVHLPGRRAVFCLAAVAGAAWLLSSHPPMATIGQGEVGIRTNQATGAVSQWRDGAVIVIPGLHDMRILSLRDRTYRPAHISQATGPAPLQSLEGLSFGADLSVRYAIDPAKVTAMARALPADIDRELVEPAVQGAIYKVFARYTVREAFSTKRAEIQKIIETELTQKLAVDGLLVRSVQLGKIDLPADYRRGMEVLLNEELASEKMRYTLELKDKRVKEVALDAEAEKVRREKAAEAAAREQVIAARGQEEAMKHVLPFKQRQIEQRQLEAEADRTAQVKRAEGSAQARRIEAGGEAEARQKLADAEVYRLDRIGKTNAEQMQREGVLVTRHPLLIQKSLADKLSDKVQVIIAPPGTNGAFLGANLLGMAGTKPDGTSQSDTSDDNTGRK